LLRRAGMKVLLGILVVTMVGVAYADPPGLTTPTATATATSTTTTTTAVAPPGELDQLATSDAASTRGAVSDSGIVLGTGKVDVTLLTLATDGSQIGVAVGVGAGVELSVDALDALGGRYDSLGGNVRLQIARGPRHAISVAAGYHWGSNDFGDAAPFLGGYVTLGGDLAYAVNDRLLTSFGLGVVHADGGDGMSGSTSLYGHADLVFGRSWVRLLTEVGFLGAPDAVVGARFASRRVSADLGLGVTGLNEVSSPLLLLALSVRN
jgi:hypothetical protein